MDDHARVDILLVDDNPGDRRLLAEALADIDVRPGMCWVGDGIEALRFLRREAPYEDAPSPRIVLLDLNLPRMDGRLVLNEIKTDPILAMTPVIVFSGSDAPQDVAVCYAFHANGYVIKPRDLAGLTETVRRIVDFWLKAATLPPRDEGESPKGAGP